MADRQAASRRVLVAEDNVTNQRLIRALLEKLNCEADLAGSGGQAVEMWAQNRYDLILMDVRMPEMDGLQATQLIRARESSRQHIPILALTADTKAEDRAACLAAGMDGHLPKPITRAALQNALSDWAGYAAVPPAAVVPLLGGGEGVPDRIRAHLASTLGITNAVAIGGLVNSYLNESTRLLDRLALAVEQQDAVTISHHAHSLKSITLGLGLVSLAEGFRELEMCGRQGAVQGIHGALARAVEAHEHACLAMQPIVEAPDQASTA